MFSSSFVPNGANPRRINLDEDDSSISPSDSETSTAASDKEVSTPSRANTLNLNNSVSGIGNTCSTSGAAADVDDTTRPPTPWGDKCTDKKNIITAMKDPTNDIHLYIGDYTESDFKNVNFKQLHSRYASRYQYSRFRPNFITILKHKLKETGPFTEEHCESEIEPWKTRSSCSKGCHFLRGLLMDSKTYKEVLALSVEELWNSNQHFRCYPKEDFEKYLKDMKAATAKARAAIQANEKLFQKDMKNFPPQEVNQKGEKFWYNHAARTLLAEDLNTSGAMKPAQLQASRKEYQDFKPRTFRKHVYQEQEKQRAAPYWRHKRNLAAQQKIAEERSEMKRQWEVDRISDKLGKLKF